MKRIILATSLLCAAFALKADLVLCWTMPGADTPALGWYVRQQTVGTATDKDGTSLAVTYAKLGTFGDVNYDVNDYAAFVNNSSYAYAIDEDYAATSTESSVMSAGEEGWAAVTAGNYYYIALFNSSDQLVAYSQTFQASNLGSSTFDTSDFRTIASFTGAFAGSGYAVPEPTSGLLVLFGMAALALRRRKIA
jgi:hypothetical protein